CAVPFPPKMELSRLSAGSRRLGSGDGNLFVEGPVIWLPSLPLGVLQHAGGTPAKPETRRGFATKGGDRAKRLHGGQPGEGGCPALRRRQGAWQQRRAN